MERLQANYSLSMPKYVFSMTSPCRGHEFDWQAYAPFQAIIDKVRQAEAQDKHDRYEARKLIRGICIKDAARIRHTEAEPHL